MDYDLTNIPAVYDRARAHGPEVPAQWMGVIESQVNRRPIGTILDLGCGTGRFSEGLASRFGARAVGLDPSEEMLEPGRAAWECRRVLRAEGASQSTRSSFASLSTAS